MYSITTESKISVFDSLVEFGLANRFFPITSILQKRNYTPVSLRLNFSTRLAERLSMDSYILALYNLGLLGLSRMWYTRNTLLCEEVIRNRCWVAASALCRAVVTRQTTELRRTLRRCVRPRWFMACGWSRFGWGWPQRQPFQVSAYLLAYGHVASTAIWLHS